MSERMLDRLSKEQLNAILDALPIEFIFVDESDRLQYCNTEARQEKMDGDGILGNDIRTCHKPESLPRTEQLLADFKSGERNEDEFWIDGVGTRLLNRFLAVRDTSGKYLGCIEYLLDFTALEKLAEAKKDSHRHAASQPDTSKLEDTH
jgi:DUF438 domain-containing protein